VDGVAAVARAGRRMDQYIWRFLRANKIDLAVR
jgi:hypothetical protein